MEWSWLAECKHEKYETPGSQNVNIRQTKHAKEQEECYVTKNVKEIKVQSPVTRNVKKKYKITKNNKKYKYKKIL